MEKINKNHIQNLEILSPAGNSECFFADINAGADAIYLGLSNFNARMKAENFTTENIKFYVDYAHLFGVKIYVTLNTLVSDEDFDDLVNLVKILTDAKVDAFIVQDMGIAYLLKNTFEGIVLHASTQLGIHNLQGAIVAEKMGFSRIVLSREAKLEDIKQIKQNTNLEIEYFIQGALCVAFSGNCYLSSLEKGKSGNEGKCLQLCRLPYKNNLTNETAYYLSARDLSLLENMQELIDAGVISFKIEGRMRHSGYTATATQIYKTALNKINSGDFSLEFAKAQNKFLMESFSRGNFNKRAYLDKETPDSIINKDYQNHIGVKIGKVLNVKPFKQNLFKVQIESSFDLSDGDGIKIIDTKNKKQIASLGIGNVTKKNNNTFEFITKYKFSSGYDVFLTQNSKFEKKILSQKRLIPLNIQVVANSNEFLKAIISLNNQKFCYESNILLEKANNIPLGYEDFLNQMSKLSETVFEINEFSLESDGVFLPKSKLNEFRRNLIEFLKTSILENYPAPIVNFDREKYITLKNKSISNQLIPKNIAIIDDGFDDFDNLSNYEIIVFSPKIYNFELIEKFYNKIGEKFALNLPTIANFYDLKILNSIIEKLPQNIKLFANNIYGLFYTNSHEVITSSLLNIKNVFAIKHLFQFNVKTICSSIESSEKFSNQNNLVSFFQGNFPLMTFAHCPFKTIFENNCKKCSYNENLNYIGSELGTYNITRTKLSNCYFELKKQINRKKSKFFIINLSK